MFKLDLHYEDYGEKKYILWCNLPGYRQNQWAIHRWSCKPSPEEVHEQINLLSKCFELHYAAMKNPELRTIEWLIE